jgi:diguanylate cyclase (GGDEF)-like protein
MLQQILLIDDSKAIHPLVKSLLVSEPVTIHSAFDGQAGLDLAASLRPDLILLDVEMPGMDGFEICRRLMADPATARLPVIFLTARVAAEELVRGLNLGAVDYVTKPFKLSELLSRVRAALRTSRLIRLLEDKAMIDALTGLGNRAMFDKRLTAEVAARIRSGNPLSCIVLDVDHFKDINDKYGHAYGDQVLCKIGDALTTICRVEDIACRLGREKFVVLAPRTSAAHAALLAERMRIAVARIPFWQQGESITVTCSFGVADAAGTFDRLMLERTEQALCHSKRKGRDCISIAPTHPKARAIAV